MKRGIILAIAAASAVAACDGFKEAMTAHVDVVARAGSQELSVKRLAELLGTSKAPLTNDVARVVTDLWVNYQLLGVAAARGDSLNDAKRIDDAMWPVLARARAKKYYDVVSKSWVPASSPAADEARYSSGEVLAARHILLQVPPTAVTGAERDSVRRKAEALRAQATPANFAALAKKNGQDGSAQQGGKLPLFRTGDMVPAFEKAVRATKPGQISPVVQTQFGYHIIYRPTYAEVKDEFAQAGNAKEMQAAESTYFAKLETASKVQVKPNAAASIKSVAADLTGHLNDKTVIATSTAGDFTAGRFARWLAGFPPQARQQLRDAPDSAAPLIVKGVLRNELFLRQADSAKVTLDTSETNEVHRAFAGIVTGAWSGLGIDPKRLADSAKTPAARERLAATRVESYIDDLVQQRTQLIQVPQPVETLLHEKYESKVNEAGIDRAVQSAQRIRATTDSTRAAQQPPSAVPMPGGAAAPRPNAAPPKQAPKPAPEPTTPPAPAAKNP